MPETNTQPNITPPPSPTGPASSSNHHIPRWVWLTVFGITIAAIIAVSLWLLFVRAEPAVAPVVEEDQQQATSTDPYADWKTYTNDEYGFELKYPQDWEVWHQTDSGANIADPNDSNRKFLTVSVYDNDPVNLFRGVDSIYEEQDFELNGVTGKKLIGDSALSGTSAITVILYRDDAYYALQASSDIYDRAISTFKFIDSSDTANWQIYRNEEFEFKYPSDVRVQEGIGGRISIEFNNDYLIEMYFVSASVGYPDCYITEEVKRQVVFGNYIWTSCDMGYTTVNPNGASLVFMPNSDLHQDWETQILSTFKFIE